MKVLSFDTSSQALSLALLEDEQLLGEVTLAIKKNHSISLMPSIDFLMHQVGLKPKDLDRIVVAKGPGSYTGLRVAVATAKTLAYSLKIDLVGVSSLLAIAANSSETGLIVPIMDARRNHVYAGGYEKEHAVFPDGYYHFNQVLQYVEGKEKVTFVGEVANFFEQIREHMPNAKVQSLLPSAYEMGKIGLLLPPEDEASFVPEYLKRVEAEENWLKTHEETKQNYIKQV